MVFNFKKKTSPEVAEYLREQRALVKAGRGIEVEKKKSKAKSLAAFAKARFKVGERVGQFVALGRQPEPFTAEQDALSQMFGGGDKIWGINNEPVRINNDLHPSLSDSGDETASLFGFGRGS